MITYSKLGQIGQLGNQLSQLALLFAVRAKRGFEIEIPKKFQGRKKVDQVELEPFHVAGSVQELHSTAEYANHYCEETFAFDPKVFEQPDYTDFSGGYYQAHQYADSVRDVLLKEFSFCPEISVATTTFVDKCRQNSKQLVAVHVRRGDYLQHPENFRVLTDRYYREACRWIYQRIGGEIPHFLVFSDDLAWCQQCWASEVDDGLVTFVRSPSHWHDLAIMTRCDHHVISASSFSWWGAWLCQNPGQLVVAPWPWFGPKAANLDTKDVIPDRWHKLEL